MTLRAFVVGLLGWSMLCGTVAVRAADPLPTSLESKKPGPTLATPNSPATPPASPIAVPGDIREAKPEVFHLRDKDGKLVQVPAFSYEEFMRLYDLSNRLAAAAAAPPAYSFQALSLDGVAEDEYVRLKVTCKVAIKQTSWVRIPLRLHAGILREPPVWDGPGKSLTDFDRDGDGYVMWVQGADNKPHSITCELLVPLKKVGDEIRLALQMPRATTSELRLTVPGANVAPRLAEGTTLTKTDHPRPDQTRWQVLGLGNDFQLSWAATDAKKLSRAPTILEARGSILVRVEGRRRVSSEARLKLSNFGGALEAVRVRLPPKMDLFPLADAGYSAAVVGETSDDAGDPVKEVEVRFEGKPTGSTDIRLRAVLPPGNEDTAGSLIQTAGFEVIGAVSQFGVVDVVVEGDWSINWVEGPAVHRLEDIPETLRQQKVSARFEYDRQPYSLKVFVQPRRTHLSADSRHVVFIEPTGATLESTIKFRVRGTRAESVELDLAGWKVDQIGPDRLIQYELLNLEKSGPLVVPLSQVGTLPNEFELKIQAHRDIAADQKSLSFGWPRPKVNSQSPAIVAIVPADNIELTPRGNELKGLVVESAAAELSLPTRQQSPLIYRDRGGTTASQFAADFAQRPRAVSVALEHQVSVEPAQTVVEQRLSYRIAHEPLKSLLLEAPKDWPAERWQVFSQLDETEVAPLKAEPLPADSASDVPLKVTRYRVTLSEDRIGALHLLVRYVRPLTDLPDRTSAPVSVPLIRPVLESEFTLAAETLRVTMSPTWELGALNGQWIRDAGRTADRTHAEHFFVSSEKPTQIVLPLTRVRAQDSNETMVREAWVQTWVAGRSRQDRAVFRVATDAPHLDVTLPIDADIATVIAAVDGVSVAAQQIGARQLQIPLAEKDSPNDKVVEISYLLAGGSVGATGNLSCELPRLSDSGTVRMFRWQLKLPGHQHLLRRPANMTPELAWRWRSLFFDQQASLSQAELETWIGAAPQPAAAENQTNQYLFSAFGPIARVEVATVERSSVVAVIAGLVLIGGLLLMFVPSLRHPSVLLIVGVLLLGVALTYAEPALIVAQGASVGVLLVVVGRGLQLMFAQRQSSRSVVRGAAISGIESKVTMTQARPSRSETGSSFTATAAGIALPVAEQKP